MEHLYALLIYYILQVWLVTINIPVLVGLFTDSVVQLLYNLTCTGPQKRITFT